MISISSSSPILAARKGREAAGVARISSWRQQLEARPGATNPLIYALGGVEAVTAPSCLAAGAWGVAAIGSVLRDEPSALLASLGIER